MPVPIATRSQDGHSTVVSCSNELWAQFEGAFLQRRGRSDFEGKINNCLTFEVVLYRARMGCPWRGLPSEYGDDYTICVRWQWRVKSGAPWPLGIWKRLNRANSPEPSTGGPDGRARSSARGRRTQTMAATKHPGTIVALSTKIRDKLAAMFLGGVFIALLAVGLKGTVNTP